MGLGQGIVRKFVHEGARVMIFDINAELGTQVASSLPQDQIHLFTGSVTEERHWKEALQTVLERWGGLDVVVRSNLICFKSRSWPAHSQLR